MRNQNEIQLFKTLLAFILKLSNQKKFICFQKGGLNINIKIGKFRKMKILFLNEITN